MTPHWRDSEWADGIGAFGARLRRGETTALGATERALARIAAHDDQMQAFVHVAPETALKEAAHCDALLARGEDLGPLMGVPVGVKDLFAVEGMPTRAGSHLDVSHAIGPEGPFVARLRAAGAVILGKCRSIEFAAGAQNISHPTPWNPADPKVHRSPGGSSNGSATAVAAGYCPLAIGSDTGGSVRAPAALCGLMGHKFTAGSVPLDGVFPLCARLDSVGTFTVDPGDAALVFEALMDDGPDVAGATPPSLAGCRFGIPHDDMLDVSGMDPEVAEAWAAAQAALTAHGADLVPLDWPSTADMELIAQVFAGLIPAELAETIGHALLAAEGNRVDPVAMHRLGPGRIDASTNISALQDALTEMTREARERMAGLQALVYPTTPMLAPPLEEVRTAEAAVAFNKRVLSLTRVVNAYGLSACSLPLPRPEGALPIGLDIATPAGEDNRCLALASAIGAALSR